MRGENRTKEAGRIQSKGKQTGEFDKGPRKKGGGRGSFPSSVETREGGGIEISEQKTVKEAYPERAVGKGG